MSESDDSLIAEVPSSDVPNDVPIVLGSRFHLDIPEFSRLDQRRVKFYIIHDGQWKDLGTGHVMCHEGLESFIVFRLENEDTNYFESMIRKESVYDVQQDSLIIWEEFETEVALSFQCEYGCADFYATLHRILGRNPATEVPGDDAENGSDPEGDKMPPLEIACLVQIEKYITDHMETPRLRAKLARQIDNERFMPTLTELFHFLESSDSQMHLTKLAAIANSLLSMDDLKLLERVLDDRYLKDLIGMLEYDASAPKGVKHRSVVYDQSRFKEIVPIGDDACVTKIHRLFRLQYILEHCLPQPSPLDETPTVMLSAFIDNLRSEVFQGLQDSGFAKNMVSEIRSDSTEAERRRRILHLFVDFIDMGVRVAGASEGALFTESFTEDVLSIQLPCVTCPDPIVRLKGVEILDRLVTLNSSRVLSFLHKQATESPQADILVNKLLLLIVEDLDSELSTAVHVADLMRNVLSPESPCSPKRGEFLNYFYKIPMQQFIVAFVETLQTGMISSGDYHFANKAYCAINFIHSCLQQDRGRFRRLIQDYDVITTALVILESKHHFLVLGGLRLLRLTVGFLDPVFDKYVVMNDCFAPVVECAKKNRLRDNMLKASIEDLFSFVATSRHLTVISYAVEEHGEDLEKLIPEIYEDLLSQHEHNPQQGLMAKRRTQMRVKLAIGTTLNEAQEENAVEDNDENANPADVSMPKTENFEVKRFEEEEEEEKESKANDEKSAKKEVNQDVDSQTALVDYGEFFESDDQGEEEKPADQEEPSPAPRPFPGTPRPVHSRALKRPLTEWDENDKPPTAPEAKKSF